MRKFIVLTLLWCFSGSVFAQTAESKYLIKYLETNTAQPDYGVTFLSDNQFIYKSPNTEKINTNSEKLSESNLFLATVGSEGDIIEKKQIEGLPTDKITKTGAAYSPDLKTVYFSAKKYRKTPKRKDKEQLYKADVDVEGNWTNVVKLPFSKEQYSFGEPSLSVSGKELYFTSDMPSTFGGADIFRVVLNADGSFGEPINLGNRINTSGNEVTPYITKNLKLYFSSDNHKGGLGNLDVYCIDLNNPTAKANHLDAPINSVNDDFAFIINNNDDRGYFSSNRLQGQNNHDIYSFLVEKAKEDGPCLQEITGVVKDNGTQEIISDAIITLFDDENNELEQTKTDAEGKYSLTLDCNKTYTVKAGAKNYNTEDHIVNTANYLEAPTLEANKFLIQKSAEEIGNDNNLISDNEVIKEAVEEVTGLEETIEEKSISAANNNDDKVEKTIESEVNTATTIEEDEAAISPVYFAFDRAIITSKSARELDKLSKILKNNKNIHVELSSYTDSRGNSAYNLKLSERRARASADYLVSQGIDRSRIIAKGYGESKMVNKCIDGIECSEAAHEKNRRTEFAFINPQVSTQNFDKNPVNELTKITETKEKSVKEVVQTSSDVETTKPENVVENSIKEIEPKQPEVITTPSVTTQVKSTDKTIADSPIETERLNIETEDKSSTTDNTKKEKVAVAESPKTTTNTDTSNKKVTPAVVIDEANKEEESLSEEAKWLNREIEKSKEENNKLESKKNKPQLIEPITESNQKADVKNELLDKEYNNLVATAKAEEKVEEKFNFEKQKEQTNKPKSTVDPNQLLADLKAKGVSNRTDNVSQPENNATEKEEPTVKKDARLNTSQVSVKAMQSKRGKYVETDNAKRIHALRVIFRIQPNMKALKGYKDAYVVIKSPTGKIVNEKGVFPLADGKDQAYTDITTLYYNQQSIKAVMFIDKLVHKFTKGTYTVNIFIDGIDVGENILTLS